MPLKEKVNHEHAAFYAGYLVGLRYARRILQDIRWKAESVEAKNALDLLDRFLDDEEANTITYLSRAVFTTKYEKNEIIGFDLKRDWSKLEKEAVQKEA